MSKSKEELEVILHSLRQAYESRFRNENHVLRDLVLAYVEQRLGDFRIEIVENRLRHLNLEELVGLVLLLKEKQDAEEKKKEGEVLPGPEKVKGIRGKKGGGAGKSGEDSNPNAG